MADDRLRILLLVEASGGDPGRHALDLAGGLAAQGNEVHLLYSPARMDAGFARNLRALDPRVRVAQLPLRQAPHWADFAAARRLRRYLRVHGAFQVLHAHGAKAGLLAGLAGRGLADVRLYTAHAPISLNPALPLPVRLAARTYDRAIAARLDGIVAVSPEEREHLRGIGIPVGKLFLVPYGLRPQPEAGGAREQVRRALGLAEADVCIGLAVRFSPRKNPAGLLRALTDMRVPARLALVGAGPQEPALHSLARRPGVDGRICRPGPRDGTALLPALDIFALAGDCQAMSYVLLEAMAAGLPLVSARAGGASLLIEEGANGLVVPAGRFDLLRAALEKLAGSAPLRRAMGLRSSEIVRRFPLEAMVQETVAVYQRILSPRRSGRPWPARQGMPLLAHPHPHVFSASRR